MTHLHLRPRPVTRDDCNAFIEDKHRHHGRVVGYRYAVGAERGAELVGVAVMGRPNARMLPQYSELEVTRLCADGSKNVCSFLYSRCSRVARELGFEAVYTYILESESGDSLKAAGWEYIYTTAGGTHDRPSRRRKDSSPICPKQLWAPQWCAAMLRARAA